MKTLDGQRVKVVFTGGETVVANKFENFRTLFDFCDYWVSQGIMEREMSGRRLVDALVTYRCKKRKLVHQRTQVAVFLTGFGQEGRIEITPQGRLTTKSFHLGFSAEFQQYNFDREVGILVVGGDSPKMGGRYVVEIRPVAATGK